MKAKDRPKVIWGNGVNLSGLWWDRPRRFVLKKDCGVGAVYWDSSGDFDLWGPFEHRDHIGIITFGSVSKAEAEAWTKGARAVMDQLKRWAN